MKEEPFTLAIKLKYILKTSWRGLTLILAPILFLPLLLPFPPEKYQWCAYTLALMATFWVTECIPLPVTSFLPLVIFPLTGTMDTSTTCHCYMNDTIMMFIGSLILASAVEQSGLHNRLALAGIRAIGYSHLRLLFALTFITMFVSLWISNTATTTVMMPINFALLSVFEEQNILKIFEVNSLGESVASEITACYFCTAAYASTIGGFGTLISSPTNLVFKGLFVRTFPDAPEYISFPSFSAFSWLFLLLMETGTYLSMAIIYLGFLRPNSKEAKRAKITPAGIAATEKAVNEHWKRLGRITFQQYMVIVLFSLVISLFFFRAPQIIHGWGDAIHYAIDTEDDHIKDSAAAFLVAFLMFLLPSEMSFLNYFKGYRENWPTGPTPSVVDYTEMNKKMAYNYMFLLGGGFALSTAASAKYTNLNARIGNVLKIIKGLPHELVMLIVIIFTVILTNFASSVAVCNVIAPIAMQLAVEIHLNPLWYALTAGVATSGCFCLPVGTPGNLIVQSAAKIPTYKMIRVGAAPTVLCIIISWFCLYVWAPVIWPIVHVGVPSWVNSSNIKM